MEEFRIYSWDEHRFCEGSFSTYEEAKEQQNQLYEKSKQTRKEDTPFGHIECGELKICRRVPLPSRITWIQRMRIKHDIRFFFEEDYVDDMRVQRYERRKARRQNHFPWKLFVEYMTTEQYLRYDAKRAVKVAKRYPQDYDLVYGMYNDMVGCNYIACSSNDERRGERMTLETLESVIFYWVIFDIYKCGEDIVLYEDFEMNEKYRKERQKYINQEPTPMR